MITQFFKLSAFYCTFVALSLYRERRSIVYQSIQMQVSVGIEREGAITHNFRLKLFLFHSLLHFSELQLQSLS